MNEILLNMEEIGKRRMERKDNRGWYLRNRHIRAKKYRETNPEKSYKECLTIVSEEMREERGKQEIVDVSGGDCLE
jgi:hypothetical protein